MLKALKISVVNSQTTKKELVKVLTCGRRCDYRVYGSDMPLVNTIIIYLIST